MTLEPSRPLDLHHAVNQMCFDGFNASLEPTARTVARSPASSTHMFGYHRVNPES